MPIRPLLALIVALPACLLADTPYAFTAKDAARVEQVRLENQPVADQGDGFYRNPILPGHYHDPTVLRVGEDYYLSHCEHDRRGPIVWHSRDLVNWRPLARIDSLAGIGVIWATDLIHHEGLFYLYLPLRLDTPDGSLSFSNYVVTAEDPAGPWSEPVDLGIGGIDPGHVVDSDGVRYLYVNQGRVATLSPDGQSVTEGLRQTYAGWPIPEAWTIECDCLESPKLFWRDGWCYMVSALGGTAGPSTSHLVAVARSRSALGPWENDPDSPLLRTELRDEPWWSQGHGTLVEATDGSWWMHYHAIARGLRSGGRNTLMVPIEWTEDGWPRIPAGQGPANRLPIPPGQNVGHGMPLSDDFSSDALAIQWDLLDYMPDFAQRVRSGGGQLVLQAQGSGPDSATRIAQLPVNRSYEITAKVRADTGAAAGIGLSSSHGFVGLQLEDGVVTHLRRGNPAAEKTYPSGSAWLRVRNVDHDVTFYHSADGLEWTKFHWGAALSTESVQRIVLFAAGDGQVAFESYRYRGL